jgi:DMSO/TMAO reductase YedYZ molybdopterin-dependent catalytic subunit
MNTDEFKRLQAARFVDWRVNVDGMAARPASFSLAEIRSFPTQYPDHHEWL